MATHFFDTKIISKALSERLKNVLSSLIWTQQTAYIKSRFIGGGRLISDIVKISDRNNIGGFLVTIDIGKAFDSLYHKFILTVLKKFGFGKNFVSWVEPRILCYTRRHHNPIFPFTTRCTIGGPYLSLSVHFMFRNFI